MNGAVCLLLLLEKNYSGFFLSTLRESGQDRLFSKGYSVQF